MSSLQYISDSDGSDIVHFDEDAVPTPFPKPSGVGSVQTTIAGSANAARKRSIDFGSGGGGTDTLDINLPYISSATYALLLAKYKLYPPAQVIYSPDDGTTRYLCSWVRGEDGFVPIVDAGIDPYTVSLQLRIKLRIDSTL